jgi:hypothetical protein
VRFEKKDTNLFSNLPYGGPSPPREGAYRRMRGSNNELPMKKALKLGSINIDYFLKFITACNQYIIVKNVI